MKKKAWIAAAFTLVAGFEGMRNKAYLDPVGIPTICFGYTYGVRLGQEKSTTECRALLDQEVTRFASRVEQSLPGLSPGEYVAYTSFAYNVGLSAFESSTLRRLAAAGQREAACQQLPRWVYARGVKLPGLVNRRAEEMNYCLGGVHGLSH